MESGIKSNSRRVAIESLRSSKLAHNTSFEPSQAYAIFGHGYDPNPETDTVIIPDNCVVVVKTLPGEFIFIKYMLTLLQKLFNKEKIGIYENPLCYVQKLINDFGSLMIYKPGDKCPNFRYWLAPNTKDLKLQDGKLNLKDSEDSLRLSSVYGLIPLRGTTIETFGYQTIQTTIPVREFVPKLYKHSILPTISMFKRWLREDWYMEFSLKKAINTQKDWHPHHKYIPFFPDETLRTQKQLFDQDPVTGLARRPGVYYNFVCRSVPGSSLKFYNLNFKNQRVGVNPTLQRYFTAPRPIQNIWGRRLVEAEQRKHLLPGSRFNTSFKNTARNARLRKSRKSRKTRKSRK